MTPHNQFQKQIYEFLLESQYFPESEVKHHQHNQLEHMVRFAKAEVPFYKNRLNCLFRHDGTLDFARWHDVPILTREDLLNHRVSMLAHRIPEGHGAVADFTGTGTTGIPVTTRHNALIGMASQAALFRAFTWNQLDLTKNMFRWHSVKADEARAASGVVRAGWGPAWEPASAIGKIISLNHVNPVAQAADLLEHYRPAYVTGRANNLFDLAQEMRLRGAPPKLDCMFAFGANLSDATRDECLDVFGSKVMDIYNSKEVYDIAHQCPQTSNLHVNWELMLVEVLDDNNIACPPGVQGRCIVTPFYNTAQPLIRYDIGDQITLAPNCSCGRTLQTIESLNGRTIHMFRLQNGTKISPRFPGFLKKLIGAHEWQFAQLAINTVEVRYLKLADAPQAGFDELTQIIRGQMAADTQVIFKPMAKLPLTAAGKLLEAICELPPKN